MFPNEYAKNPLVYKPEQIYRYPFAIDLQLFASAEEEGRTEEPTEYKRRKAREEGKVAKSQELVSSLILIFTFWTIAIFSSFIIISIIEMLVYYLTNLSNIHFTIEDMNKHFIDIVWMTMKPCIPVFIVSIIISLAGNVAQVGFLFASKAVAPDFKRVEFKFNKVFISKQTLVNLVKSILKVLIVFIIAYLILSSQMSDILNTAFLDVTEGFHTVVWIVFQLVTAVGLAMIVLSIPDFIFQRMEYIDSLKMSRKEIKDERKDTEGDPYMKQVLRERQREILSRRMLEEVPTASVVITNPTHYAIALKYDMQDLVHKAPVVIAKGMDHMAKRIIEIARENDVVVYENKYLAQLLYKQVDIGEEIPEEFYQSVADILGFVYKLKGIHPMRLAEN